MAKPLRVLIVEDSPDDADLLVRELRKGGFEPEWKRVETQREMGEALAGGEWDVIISDYTMPRFSAPAALEFMQASGLDLPFLIVSGTVGEETAVAAMRAGAQDFLLKSQLSRLVPAVERGLRDAEEQWRRRAAEQALRESEARMRAVVEAAPFGAHLYELQGEGSLVLIGANSAADRILGVAHERLVGKTIEEALPVFVGGEIPNAFRRVAGLGEQFDRDQVGVAGRGARMVLEVHAFQTGPKRMAVFFADVTERLDLQEQLVQSQRMEAVGRLAGGVAHDFNNLLQAMLSQTQLLQVSAADPQRVRATARELEEQVKRGAGLTRQLLLFSRRETVRPERLDLNQIVNGATLLLRRLVRENIAFVVELAQRPPMVEVDRGQLEQVLMNLVVNASDAMPDGGKLVVRTGRENGGWAWLAVEDTGSGIPEAIRDRIFEPFFTTKSPDRGTGLGLAVVHGIVEQHGGRIELRTETGRGTTVRILLPKLASGEAPAVAPYATELGGLPEGRGEAVLVVEDEDGAREGLREILTGLGYRVVAVASAEEAGLLPERPPFDLLLTDLLLPGLSGADLAQGLQDRWPRLKVILMSGYAEDEAVRRGVNAGAVHFLQKPFDMGTLAREVRSALDERHRSNVT